MEKLVLFYPDKHELHSERGHPERPERVEAIRFGLEDSGIWGKTKKLQPVEIPLSVLHSVHDKKYLHEIKTASEKGIRADMDTYLTTRSWQLALNSAGGGIAVSEAVWNMKAKRGFALCRPPGHHATPDQAMGFCILNNIALSAENLIQNHSAKRIVIIDLDVHHGNGTQDIFWERDDVFFISIHQSPLYPGTGHQHEIGSGIGEGFNLNIPLPPNSGDQARKTSMKEIILPKLKEYQPEILLISVGFDAHWKDPLAQQLASTQNYGKLISDLRIFADENCDGKIAVFLEGGYDLQAGADSAVAVTQALLGEPLEESKLYPRKESSEWKSTISQIKKQWEIE